MENNKFSYNVGRHAIISQNMVKLIGEEENCEDYGDCQDMAQYVFEVNIIYAHY